MINAILATIGLGRESARATPRRDRVRRVRWRGSDGRWEWQAA